VIPLLTQNLTPKKSVAVEMLQFPAGVGVLCAMNKLAPFTMLPAAFTAWIEKREILHKHLAYGWIAESRQLTPPPPKPEKEPHGKRRPRARYSSKDPSSSAPLDQQPRRI